MKYIVVFDRDHDADLEVLAVNGIQPTYENLAAQLALEIQQAMDELGLPAASNFAVIAVNDTALTITVGN